MERLYAVPSEKLRVWSIWLTKIVEIADEWQKWLRAHIDFTIRLSDHLYAAELAIRRSKMVSSISCNDQLQADPLLDIYVKHRAVG